MNKLRRLLVIGTIAVAACTGAAASDGSDSDCGGHADCWGGLTLMPNASPSPLLTSDGGDKDIAVAVAPLIFLTLLF
jgi:hypothetical protein